MPVARRKGASQRDKYICWQPAVYVEHRPDLVIITQENSIFSNYPLLLRFRRGHPRVAFSRHGANVQSDNPNGLKERFKRFTCKRVDWWVAYTGLGVELVTKCGFPPARIANLENAVDTTALQSDVATITPGEVAALREELRLPYGRIGICLGSLYAEKRLDFLYQAADRLYAHDRLFRLLIHGRWSFAGSCKSALC